MTIATQAPPELPTPTASALDVRARTGGRFLSSLVVAAIIPILLFGASVAYFIADASRNDARREAARTVAVVADSVTAALRNEIEIAQALTALPSLDEPNLERFYRTAQRIAPDRALWKTVSIADTDGMQRMNILRHFGDVLGPVTDRASFEKALKTARPAIGGVGPVGPLSGQRLVSMSVPVIRDGKVTLVLIVGLSPAELQWILATSGAPKDWIGAIVDADGNIVARSTGHEDVGRAAGEAAKAAISRGPSGEYRGRTREGVEVDTLYRQLPGDSGWSVHFGVPSATLNGPVTRSMALLVASCAVCLLLAGGLAQVTARDLEQRRRESDDYTAMVLAMSEERAAVAIKAANLGTWRLDTETGRIAGSSRTHTLLDLPDEMHDGRLSVWNIETFLSAVHPEDRAELIDAFRKCSDVDRALDIEFRVRQPDRTYRWLRAAGRRATLEEDSPRAPGQRSPIIHGVIADIDSIKRATAERLRLTKRLAEAQENEQRRIARELHDQVGQSLTGLSLGLKRLEQDLPVPSSSPLRERVLWLESLTSDISRDIHRAAADLRPVALDDVGLPRALTALADELSARHGLSIDVQPIGLSGRLPPDVETAVYRISQEGLTNILKHADASTASVIMEKRENSIHLVIEDNGRGFDAEDPKAESLDRDIGDSRPHLGLLSIRERVSLLGGSFRIESGRDSGTSLFVELPVTGEKTSS